MSEAKATSDSTPKDSQQATAPSSLPWADWGETSYRIDVEVGRAVTTIERLLKLKEGDIIVLDRLAHETVGLSVEGRLLGRAEVNSGSKNAVALVTRLGGEK